MGFAVDEVAVGQVSSFQVTFGQSYNLIPLQKLV
jgi:hypothetical protein